MNVFIDSTGAMYFGDERETARNCPHCHALSRMSPTALPTFDELLLQKPRVHRRGAALSCLHRAGVPALRRRARSPAIASSCRRRRSTSSGPIEKFAFNYVPE